MQVQRVNELSDDDIDKEMSIEKDNVIVKNNEEALILNNPQFDFRQLSSRISLKLDKLKTTESHFSHKREAKNLYKEEMKKKNLLLAQPFASVMSSPVSCFPENKSNLFNFEVKRDPLIRDII